MPKNQVNKQKKAICYEQMDGPNVNLVKLRHKDYIQKIYLNYPGVKFFKLFREMKNTQLTKIKNID